MNSYIFKQKNTKYIFIQIFIFSTYILLLILLMLLLFNKNNYNFFKWNNINNLYNIIIIIPKSLLYLFGINICSLILHCIYSQLLLVYSKNKKYIAITNIRTVLSLICLFFSTTIFISIFLKYFIKIINYFNIYYSPGGIIGELIYGPRYINIIKSFGLSNTILLLLFVIIIERLIVKKYKFILFGIKTILLIIKFIFFGIKTILLIIKFIFFGIKTILLIIKFLYNLILKKTIKCKTNSSHSNKHKLDNIITNYYTTPNSNMLKDINVQFQESKDIIIKHKRILQATLNNFNLDAKVVNAIIGPSITRFEIIPNPGINLQKFLQLELNLKLELQAKSIRILAPIPGKGVIGVEIPNENSSITHFKKIICSKLWINNKFKIPIIVGENIEGLPIIFDLSKAPHLLIAGSTGSGKSVYINTLIMSLLFQFSPKELQFIMIDPKFVELNVYKQLPHLLTPIITNIQHVPTALNWSIIEMEKRYQLLEKNKVKNIYQYNQSIISQNKINNTNLPKMSLIVIIIDELADIVLSIKNVVETCIAKIAQKARAVGIHLVLATQRPSTNIITGIIKANLPTRIAFKVTSIIDSRVILDHKGAELLLGRGDMLFTPPNCAYCERIQGAIIYDQEIKSIVNFCCSQLNQHFKFNMNEFDQNNNKIENKNIFNSQEDILVNKVITMIKNDQYTSISYIQRKFNIGYNKAANIIEKLEQMQIIGPQKHGPLKREVLIKKNNII